MQSLVADAAHELVLHSVTFMGQLDLLGPMFACLLACICPQTKVSDCLFFQRFLLCVALGVVVGCAIRRFIATSPAASIYGTGVFMG